MTVGERGILSGTTRSLSALGGGRGRRLLPLLVLCYVQTLVNGLWYRSDLSIQFSLNCVQVEAVLVCDEVDGKPQMAKTARAAYSMEVGLRRLGEVKVDDYIHSLDVNASCQQVWLCVCMCVCVCICVCTEG